MDHLEKRPDLRLVADDVTEHAGTPGGDVTDAVQPAASPPADAGAGRPLGALLEAMANGTEEEREAAWAECYERFHRTVWQHVFYVVRSISWLAEPREVAADVTSDVFVGLPDAARRYSEDGRAEYWLKRVAIRTALRKKEQLTGAWRAKRPGGDSSGSGEAPEGGDAAPTRGSAGDGRVGASAGTPNARGRSFVAWDDVEEQVIATFDAVQADQVVALRERIDLWRVSPSAEERKWAEFLGLYCDGYDDAEIAARMGWSNQGTVRNWRSRIIRRLADLIGEDRS